MNAREQAFLLWCRQVDPDPRLKAAFLAGWDSGVVTMAEHCLSLLEPHPSIPLRPVQPAHPETQAR